MGTTAERRRTEEDLALADVASTLEAYFKGCREPVVLAYLFGSQAMGRPTPLSDVDVAVLLDEPDPARRRASYLTILGDLARRLEPRQVDLLLLGQEGEPLAYRAVAEGRLLHSADEGRRVHTEEAALRELLDRQDLDAIRSRYVGRRVREGRMGQGGADMIDRRVVEERLDFIERMLGQLKTYRPLSLEEFTRDAKTCHAALYELQTVLEAVADIGNHLVAALGLRRPGERGEIPEILGQAEIIPEEIAGRLRRALAMRNMIVHGYLRLVTGMVHSAIREDLGDIESFCGHVLNYLDTHR